MKTVLLCGGLGTRIRDVSREDPKPMVPIGADPIMLHLMRYYGKFGFGDFVLCLGYRGDRIRNFFLNYNTSIGDMTVTLGEKLAIEHHQPLDEEGWRITFAETGLETLTGGRVRRIRKYVEGESAFFLNYSDGLGDIDLNALLAFHNSHGKAVTVTGVRPPGRFGELTIGDGGRVLGFNEKPQVGAGRISGGFFVCSPKLFDYLPDRDDMMLEEDPMRSLVADGELMVYRHDGFWQPMDTYRDYSYLNKLWNSGTAPWVSSAQSGGME